MAYTKKNIRIKFFEILPILFLLFISFNGSSIVDFNFISISLHYIIVYYWVLRQPNTLGYGFIFLSGVITDVIFGFPMGVNSLTLLIIASVAAYIRVVTVRITLINDWLSFIPALLLANFIYFISLYTTDYSIDYFYFFKNSIFTFIFYPILWIIFSMISKLAEA